jgi:hypothetical protein
MARINTGDNLSAVKLQPGAKFQEDGYGLVIGTCVFKADRTASVGSTINRGSACPIGAYSYCKAHRFSVNFDSLGIATYTVEYVGLDPALGGVYSTPQVGASQGLTSEHLTTHPNFFTLASSLGFSGAPIAGVGPSPGTINNPNYTATTDGEGRSEYTGNNGATFEKKTGGRFLGFKLPSAKDFYGKTNYLTTQTSFSGHFYTSANTVPKDLVAKVGRTSGNGSFLSGPGSLLPSYMGTGFTYDSKNQLLLSQVNTEDFSNGLIYKVNYEIRYNRNGYAKAVYADAL